MTSANGKTVYDGVVPEKIRLTQPTIFIMPQAND